MTIEVYEVDTAVPIPEARQRMPLNSLEVGESFLFPLSKRASVQTLTSKLKRDKDKEFVVKKQDNEVARVWRTK